MDNIFLKNSSILVVAQVISKLISFGYALFIANILGVSNFGLYILALSYFSLASSISDLGISRYLVREISLDYKKIGSLVPSVCLLRIILVLFLYSILIVVLTILDTQIDRRQLTLLALSAVIPQVISITLDSIFVSTLKIKYSALSLILLSIFTTVVGLIMVLIGLGVFGVMLALLLGQVLYLFVNIYLASRYRIQWKIDFQKDVIGQIIKESLPYGVLAIIGLVSFKMDTLILSYFKGNYETGIYGVAYKFLEAVSLIPASVGVVFFPIVTKLHIVGKDALKSTYYKYLPILVGLGTVISILFIVILPLIIIRLLPQYFASINIIKILALAIPFIFAHILTGQILLSSEKYLKHMLILFMFMFSINLLLYLIFIPIYGNIGAAWITVLSEIMTFAVFFFYFQFKVIRGTN